MTVTSTVHILEDHEGGKLRVLVAFEVYHDIHVPFVDGLSFT